MIFIWECGLSPQYCTVLLVLFVTHTLTHTHTHTHTHTLYCIYTSIDGMILVSSGEDEVVLTGTLEERKTIKKRPTRQLSLEDIVSKAKCVVMYNYVCIVQTMYTNFYYL